MASVMPPKLKEGEIITSVLEMGKLKHGVIKSYVTC